MKQVNTNKAEWYGGAKANGGGNPTNPPVDPWPNRFQGATALATCLYFGATVWILCEMRRFNRRALLLSLASNRETKKAANAAKSSADTAKRALEVLERADVLIEKIDLSGGPGFRFEGKPVQDTTRFYANTVCTVTVKNYGRTRAENLAFQCQIISTEFSDPKKYDSMHVVSVPAILGAGERAPLSFGEFGRGFSQESIDEINAGRANLFVDVDIAYEDVFANPHEVQGRGDFLPASGRFNIAHRG